MAEEQIQSPAPEPSNEPTIDSVAREFRVDEVASQFQPQQPQQYQQPAPAPTLGAEIPDPVLDQAGFKSWLATQNQGIRQALSGVHNFQQKLQVAEIQRAEEADLKSAVQTLKGKLEGVEVDDDSVEVFLGVQARKEPKLKAIWDARHKNPAAWNAALTTVIAPRLKNSLSYRTDPQLTENVRAAKQSTSSSLTTKDDGSANPIEKKLSEAKDSREFDRIWASLRNE